MVLFIIAMVYGGVLLLDYKQEAAKGTIAEKTVYLALLFISFAVLTLNELGVTLPTPTAPIKAAVHAIFGI
jgi:hypothetical protein